MSLRVSDSFIQSYHLSVGLTNILINCLNLSSKLSVAQNQEILIKRRLGALGGSIPEAHGVEE